MIKINNVSKQFGSFNALNQVSFDIEAGEIVGLVGKNGAGKTTLMRILTSYYRASSGTVSIDGEEVTQSAITVRKKIGYLPETPPLYLDMSVKRFLKFAAEIKGVTKQKRASRLERVLEECQLETVVDKTIGNLSKGFKQRVGIAQAIIHQPEILILDEPTSGLDPIQNLQLRNLIKSLQSYRTVILSTHILSEIEQIAQRVLIIKAGEIIVDRPLEALLNDHNHINSSSTELDEANHTAASLEDIFVHYHQEYSQEMLHDNKVTQYG